MRAHESDDGSGVTAVTAVTTSRENGIQLPFSRQITSGSSGRTGTLTEHEVEMQRRRAFAERFPELSARAAADSAERVAFIRSLPTVPVLPEQIPKCQAHCRTLTVWREAHGNPWRCFTCDEPGSRAGNFFVRRLEQ